MWKALFSRVCAAANITDTFYVHATLLFRSYRRFHCRWADADGVRHMYVFLSLMAARGISLDMALAV
jgi:hypothetical protein